MPLEIKEYQGEFRILKGFQPRFVRDNIVHAEKFGGGSCTIDLDTFNVTENDTDLDIPEEIDDDEYLYGDECYCGDDELVSYHNPGDSDCEEFCSKCKGYDIDKEILENLDIDCDDQLMSCIRSIVKNKTGSNGQYSKYIIDTDPSGEEHRDAIIIQRHECDHSTDPQVIIINGVGRKCVSWVHLLGVNDVEIKGESDWFMAWVSTEKWTSDAAREESVIILMPPPITLVKSANKR